MNPVTVFCLLCLAAPAAILSGCAASDSTIQPLAEDQGMEPDEQSMIDESAEDRRIRVACVGDSITFGSGIEDRERNAYPARLGRLLGDAWSVRNFGVGGSTLLRQGNKPYWDQAAFEEAKAFEPHVVIIKLGTNDCKPVNWAHKDQFKADYREMVETFRSLETHPKVWVCYPVPAFREGEIRRSRIRDEVIPLISEVSRETGAAIIDLHTPLDEQPYLFKDGVHPNALGAEQIARAVFRELVGEEAGSGGP
jgi:lysophospholipase L1-like esterase